MLRRRLGSWAAAAALALGLALPAAGAPLALWLEPNGSFGFDDASTNAALAAGIGSLPNSSFFSNPSSGPAHISVTTPSPIPGVSRTNATRTDPSSGESTWTVTALDRDYDDLWIVIQGHDPNDPLASHYNRNDNIGLLVDPADPNWSIVRPSVDPTVAYLAYFVGDLAQGDSFDVPISYVVAQTLKHVSNDPNLCVFPQYRVNFLELSVPEPVVLSLLAFGGTVLAIRRRRVRQ